MKMSKQVVGAGLWFMAVAGMAAACADDENPSESSPLRPGGSGGASAGAASGGSAGVPSTAGTAGVGAAGAGGSSGSSGVAGDGGSAGSAGAGTTTAPPDAGSVPPEGTDSGVAAAFSLRSPAFAGNDGCGPGDGADACDLFPVDNTGLGDGADVSPQLDWQGAPAGTQSFAIAFTDLSNPLTHWVMWNIPGATTGLPAELPPGFMPGVPAADTQQISFRDDDGFAGSGQCGNVYELVLFALDTPTFAPPNTNSGNAVRTALDGSDAVLGTATLRARSNPEGPCDN